MIVDTTRSLVLRHIVPEDAAALLVLSNEPASRAWLPSQVYRDAEHARAAVEFLIAQAADPADPRLGPYVLAIEDRADGSLLGHVGFSPLDGEVEIGFSIAESRQGRGFATEAIVAAARWVFARFHLERIVAITDAANVASQRTLARAGFIHEGDRTMTFQGTEKLVRTYVLYAGPGT